MALMNLYQVQMFHIYTTDDTGLLEIEDDIQSILRTLESLRFLFCFMYQSSTKSNISQLLTRS